MTYEDYLHFPEGERWELIDGSAHVVPSPNRRHQETIGRLYLRLATFVEQHGGGDVLLAPFDVILSDFDVVQPDIVFVSDMDAEVLTDANIRGTPSWAIEVVSPTHPERDRKLKLERYQLFGVPEYWIVDPFERKIEVYTLADGTYGDAEVLRPPAQARPQRPVGFVIDLGDLFR